ncbi:MAG TPA: SGNH/GDSL hydrolase family protein, partial [Bryobacteraceae bacterium]|nr:SGNH/GDSL hydrolase family protein [Bryobacteraceae bacterium]
MRRLLSLIVAMGALHGAAAPLRVLFLGNSYTYYHHLAGLVEGMARAAGGRPIEARSVTLGGATLEALYRETEALTILRGGKWDVVVLQEQSTLGVHIHNGDAVINLPAAFHTWARVWDTEIRAHGARTAFLQTWARRGRPEQQPHLNWSYASIAKELNAAVIPAGMAFQLADGIELYQPDGSHPSAAGSYLAACVAVQVLAG